MNARENMTSVVNGLRTGSTPVAVPYIHLYMIDHFSELTGRPQWEVHKWMHSAPEEYLETFEIMRQQIPFDILQPLWSPLASVRENLEFVEHDGIPCQYDKSTGNYTPLETVSGHHRDDIANEEQIIFDVESAMKISVASGEQLTASGVNDYMIAVSEKYGQEHYVLVAGVIGTLYSCHGYLGLTNLYGMLVDAPELVETISRKILEQNIEYIRSYAAIPGASAIFIDDATATCDMISVAHYEKFSMLYMTEMVSEIHRLGKQAIVIYFGGVADRLEQIASTGADALLMETSMKGYVNDVEDEAKRIGDRMTLFGNIDPYGVLEQASDQELEKEITRQIEAGRNARGFILSTGSPITPNTPLARVRKYAQLGRSYPLN